MNWTVNQKDSNYLIHSYRVVCFEDVPVMRTSKHGIHIKMEMVMLFPAEFGLFTTCHAQTTKKLLKHQDSENHDTQELKDKDSAQICWYHKILIQRISSYQARLLASFQG
ncbi:hypothetical protein Tco_0134419 [Tanacetum coccineum]